MHINSCANHCVEKKRMKRERGINILPQLLARGRIGEKLRNMVAGNFHR